MRARSQSAEYRLLLASCAWPRSAERVAAVRQAAQGVNDWESFLRMVNRHRVWGQVHATLAQAEVALPVLPADALRARVLDIARRNLAMAAETVRLQQAFDSADMDVCFFKGATVDALLYEGSGWRHSKDIDLLVRPERSADACRLLERFGYTRIIPPADFPEAQFRIWAAMMKECEFVHPKTGIQVEVHWQLVDNPCLLVNLDPWHCLERVNLNGKNAVTTLRRDAHFAYLCVHGARHGWGRLKWLVDIAACADAAGGMAGLLASAQEFGAGRCPAQALLACEALWPTALPPALAAELRRDRRARWLVAVALRTLTWGNAQTEVEDTPFGSLLVHISQYLFADTARFRLMQFGLGLAGYRDIIELQLPRRWTFLYPVLRLPMWAWRQLLAPRLGLAKKRTGA